ncbi:MAG: TetR family transcriptional regulator [Pseudomonadales bacterium]|nr:TetR family transcriptional regulator [Pseudomonadales bacterium]
MAESTAAKSNVGRPAGRDSEKVRSDLIEAARQHFLAREFKAVSIRQIAESAGVNGAMVNYYFGGKKGLYLAMVEDVLNELNTNLSSLNTANEITLAEFGQSYSLVLARNPWWPNFMIREVLFSEGEVREAVIEKFGTVIGPKLLHLVQQQIDNGQFRQDLNPQLTLIAFMGMTIFPFLARPVIEQVFGMKVDESFVHAISEHNQQLFLHGASA